MPKNINLKGTAGQTYNLDEIKNNSRTNTEESLVVQIWKWNPDLPMENPHSKPNPENPILGQIWLSKLVATGSAEFQELASMKIER